MKRYLLYISLLFSALGQAQHTFEFDGQLSAIGSYSPENHLNTFVGGRYLPEINYSYAIDSVRTLDFEASMNISGSLLLHPFDSLQHDGTISPYRVWARYSSRQLEIRLGLQKIDFGSAQILRPIQWFNQIDPRDPLQLTNGVYGALGKYHFKNNANIWLWALYGNDKRRGFDTFTTSKWEPELGARFQFPVPKGEVGLSYHHRNISTTDFFGTPSYTHIPEDRIGIDAKWDVVVGFWVEAALVHNSGDLLGMFNDQSLLSAGVDYTFGIGSGLGLAVEHMLFSYDERPFEMKNEAQLSAVRLSYPLGFFDNLSSVVFCNWTTSEVTFMLNYQHDFKHLSSYLMFFYNPATSAGFIQNDLINSFSGPGLRLMLVFNH